MTEFIKLDNGEETIQIGFTDQRISAHGGLSVFVSFLHWHRVRDLFTQCLPRRTSPNAIAAADLGWGFVTGILAGAKKLTQDAHPRRDPLLPQLLGIECSGSQSAYSRFFQGFKSGQANLECFNRLWLWGLERLRSRKEGYSLDVDSTQLVHEEGHHKEGVQTTRTPQGFN